VTAPTIQRLSNFIQPGDIFITETGTAQFGILDTKLTTDVYGWTQGVYGSIGYAAGAAVGGSVAAKELGRYKRLVLLTGEGSLQLTIQAFSILNRCGITPVVFVLNNKGQVYIR
jgi:pyruvate decarboxylase